LETYRIENLTFFYPTRQTPALHDISLVVRRGEFITLCGPSGCGKTTLLRHLKPSTTPHGAASGAVFFEGTHLEVLPPKDAAAKIGFVFQSPENQIVTDRVWHELAFGLESLGAATPEIRLRTAEMASFFGIQSWFYKPVSELSGGQKQILALASIMAMQPSVLILDEPTSQLDPIAAGEFLATISKINRELNVTVILTEHRLEEAFPLSSRVILMENGGVIADSPPREVGNGLRGQGHGMFLAMPVPMRVWAECGEETELCPVTVREGAEWLSGKTVNPKAPDTQEIPRRPEPAITLEDVWFKYEKNSPDVLRGLNFRGYYGEISAILGGNGTGKTTALSVISGLNKPYRGRARVAERVCALPQNPQTLFASKTVREDLLEMDGPKNFDSVVSLCRLEHLLESHPYDLSGGEQQRAALAKVLLLQPKILLLDEPTKGLDAEYKQEFAAILRKLAQNGAAVVIVSHDIEFCAEHTDRCALFFDGGIVTENTPVSFFSGNSFYTTSANRMARFVLPEAITARDIVLALGGTPGGGPQLEPPAPKSEPPQPAPTVAKPIGTSATSLRQNRPPPQNRHTSKPGIASAAIMLLTIPLTILLGIYLLDDRQFYFISTLIILQAMLPFMLVFESRKPQAREIIIIAVLCAIAVAGRSAFFMVPQFKPVAAIVIIAGVSLGGEAGFLVGTMTAFVSNMFFGQGPWTPWQMFAFGIVGFLAGVLFHKRHLGRSPAALAVFGGVAVLVLYGGIMNTAGVLMWQPNPTMEMFITAFLAGLPFDMIHAGSTAFFLLVISRAMLEKLDRIKIKYG